MAPGILSMNSGESPPSISFSGSGFMATYQLGVVQCFLNYAPWVLQTAPYVLGASAGSLVAAVVVCEMNPVVIRDEMIRFARQMKTFTLGPFNPSINVFHWLEDILNKYLSPDAHKKASGRLAVAVTRLTDGKQMIITEFHSKEEVVQALLCSCFVPGYCGILPPTFKGEYFVDGGFSRMQPALPLAGSYTLMVSPFSGETDICPSDTPCQWDMVVSGSTIKGNIANSLRVLNALYPMALETLDRAFYCGYKDAIDFLLRNDLIPYSTVKSIPQEEPGNCHQTEEPESSTEEDEDADVEQETDALSSFTDDGRVQTGNNVMETVQRLQLLSQHTPQLMFWTWHGTRHFFSFFFDVVKYTVKKNTSDRLMPIIYLLKWLKISVR